MLGTENARNDGEIPLFFHEKSCKSIVRTKPKMSRWAVFANAGATQAVDPAPAFSANILVAAKYQ
jgi:hypothetical protein